MAQFQSEIELRVKVLDKELADLEKRIAKVANPFTASGGARNDKRIRAAKQAQRAELNLVQQAGEAEDRLRETKAQKRVQTNLRRVRYLRDQRIKAANDVARAEEAAAKKVARQRETLNRRISGGIQGALISSAFPLLTGEGGNEAIFGGVGGLLGGLLAGPLGSFAGGIAGSAIGKLVTDAENLNTELAALNARLGATGTEAAVAAGDISELARQLNITKEEAADLAGTLVGVVDAGAIQEVAKAFGPVGGAPTFEAIAQAGLDEKSALQAIDSLRGQIGIKAAEELTKVLEIEGSTALQAALLDEIIRKSWDITTETAKQVTIWDQISSAVATIASLYGNIYGPGNPLPDAPSAQDLANQRAEGIEPPDVGILDSAITRTEEYLKKRNALFEQYKPQRSGGGRSGTNEEERIQQRLASLQAETEAVRRRAEIESRISQARIAEDQSLVNRLTLERELSEIRKREEQAAARVTDARLKQAIAEKASAEAAAARSRYADKEAERIAKAERSFEKQIETMGLQLEAAQAITREEREQAELQLQLLRLREANKDLTEEQLKKLEEMTRKLFEANNLSPIEGYIKKSQEQLADTESMILSLAQSVEGAMANAIGNAVTSLVTGAETIEETLSNMFEAIGQAFIKMAAEIIAKQLMMIALQTILKALGAVSGGGGGSETTVTSSATSYASDGGFASFSPFARSEGGFVGANRPYLVGERGPELFQPSTSGTIRSAETMGSYLPSNQTVAVNQPVQVSYNGPTLNFNGDDYIPRSEAPKLVAEGAKMGEMRTMASLKNKRSSRSKIGL